MSTPSPQDTERAERQMRLCRRLTDMAMDLAEAAHASALATLAAPTDPSPSPSPTPDAATLFTKFSHAARQAMLLESRIAEDLRAPRTPPREDYRRAPLRRLLHNVAAASDDAPRVRAIALERLDTELAQDPHATPADILATLSEILGFHLDPAAHPDAGFILWPPTTSTPKPHPIPPAVINPSPPRHTTQPEPSLLESIGAHFPRRT